MNNSKLVKQFKQIAFPHEHGSWGYTLEPLILALLVGFSTEGILIAISTFFIFLAHQPIRIIFNKKYKKNYKLKAYSIFSLYSFIAAGSILFVILNFGFGKLFLFFIAMILMVGYLILELNNVKRNMASELIAAGSVGIIAANIVLLAGWGSIEIISFWLIILSRAIPTTYYVRGKLQMAKRQKVQELSILLTSLLSLFIVSILVFFTNIPVLSIIAVLMLTIRAYVGMYKSAGKANVKKLGIMEFGFGILFVIIVAVGYNFNI